MSTAVHGAHVVGGMQRPHDKGEKAVGFMVSTTTGTGGGVNGLKNKLPGPYLALIRVRRTARRACVSAFGYGLDRVCLGSTKAHLTSVQLTRTAAEKQRQHREQTGRKGKLAEASQEGERLR